MAKQKEINRKFKTMFFDYDGTLFDTTEAEKFSVRDKGLRRFSPEWVQARKVFLKHIRESKPYEGWQEVFEFIVENNIQAAIVSGNGSQVLNISVKQNNLKSVFPKAKINRIGGISKKDGNPTLFKHALKLLGEDPQNVIAFGNQLCDAQAADNAGIQAVHCIWGAKVEEREQMLADKNHLCITSPHQIIDILRSETSSQIHAA